MTTGGDYMAEIDASLAEKHQVAVGNHDHITTYTSDPGHQSLAQRPQQVYYGSAENGHHSNISHHSNQQNNIAISSEVLNKTDATIHAPITSSETSATQDYSSHANYSFSTDSLGYGSTAHPNYFYGYQQAENVSNHHQVGQGQNSGFPYQLLSSFQNASPASYSGTYYNPGDYQTSSGYQTTTGYQPAGYNQSNVWNGGSGGSYPSYDYSSYAVPDMSTTLNTNAAPAHPHYQQQYSQWSGYYHHTTSSEALCPPGTENLSTTNNSSVENSAPRGGYPFVNSQPPPPGTTSWRQDLALSGLPQQGIKDSSGYNQSGGWQVGQHGIHNQHINQIQMTSSTQTPIASSHFSRANLEDQRKIMYSQSSNSRFSSTNQVSQNILPPTQTASAQDASQASRIQIPTNPRISTNVAISMPKADKESITPTATLKPAYISVAAPKLNNKEVSHASCDNMKGTLPPSLRAYVERTFARCKNDSQRAANQNIMKEMINKASMEGTLLTRNWDLEPLFPLPSATSEISNSTELSASISPLAKPRRSPSRRTKSRWEPVAEEQSFERLPCANHLSGKSVAWDNSICNNKSSLLQANSANPDVKENGWNKTKFVPAQHQTLSINNTMRPPKKQRLDDSSAVENGDVSSDSDKDQGLTKYYSSAIALANSPEETKKREYRVKRFEKGHGHQSESTPFRLKGTGAGTLYTRRSNALFLAKDHEDGAKKAVEDIDWDSLTVKGTCQEIEKRYLRLTSAPDPASVRPEEVLEKALLIVQNSQKNYLYKCDQLKSIRQDLTVQRIRNELTAKVYEIHARLALEAGDLSEYNQCQSQLKTLYSEGIQGCNWEFSAYNLLCVILHSSNNRELLSSMERLSTKAKENDAVKHALAVRAAVTSGNYVSFFKLYKKAPNLNTCLMDIYVEKMRFEAIRCMCKSYRPTLPVAYISQVLGFSVDGLEECDDWLRAHGAITITDNNGEMQLDTKTSSSTLFMPEPEDAVAHGDTTLAVDDFLARAT